MTNKIQKNQIRKIEKVLKEMGFDVDDYSGKINISFNYNGGIVANVRLDTENKLKIFE